MRKKVTFPGTIKAFGKASYHVVIQKDYVEKSGWVDGMDVEVTLELYEED